MRAIIIAFAALLTFAAVSSVHAAPMTAEERAARSEIYHWMSQERISSGEYFRIR